METRSRPLGTLALLVTTLLWGTTFVMMKAAFRELSVIWVIALRFTGAAIFLGILCALRGVKPDRGTICGGMKMGIFLFTAYLLQNLGLERIAPGKNAFLLTGYTVLTPFVVWVWEKKRPALWDFFMAAVCFTGMGMASLSGELTLGFGEAITIFSGLFYALHIVCSAREAQDRDPLALTMVQMATIAVISLAGALLFSTWPGQLSGSTWANLAYLSIICSGVCFLLQTVGQKYTTATEAALLLPFESVFAAVIAALLGEEMFPREIAGYCLMFLAAVMSQIRPGNKTQQ